MRRPILFGVHERGYVREGWFADLVIVDPERPYTVAKSNLLCQVPLVTI